MRVMKSVALSRKAVLYSGAALSLLAATPALAASLVLTGDYIKIGLNDRGTLGYSGNTSPGILYDGTGTGTFNTDYDYLTPGSPFEGFVVSGTGGSAFTFINNNDSISDITGGTLTDYSGVAFNGATYEQRAVWTGTAGSLFTITNDYAFNEGDQQLKITTTITALSDLTDITFSRQIDPDAVAADGDSSETNNFRGSGSVSANDLVYAEALVSKYVIGLYTNTSYTHNSGVTFWTTDTSSYLNGTDVGHGDNTIGLGFDLGDLLTGGTITFNYSYIFGTDINAAIGQNITGTSTTTDLLNGSVNPVLDGGTLVVDAPGTYGMNLSITDNDGTIDTDGNDATFAGNVSGSGTLRKTGAGNLDLTGTSAFSGTTIVEHGRLSVNGSLAASNVEVQNGASIGGNGTVGGLIVYTGGTAAPGNSIGELTSATFVVFEAGSTYEVEVDAAGNSDRVVATTTATIEGGTVAVLAEDGDYLPQTEYEILTAGGGVTGTFEDVTSNLAFLTPTLRYGPNAVTLTLTRNDISFAGAGTTHNQIATGTAIDGAFAPGSAVFNALVGASTAEAGAGLDAFSGEIHASSLSIASEGAAQLRRSLLGRSQGAAKAPEGRNVVLWSEAGGNWIDRDGNGNAADVNSSGYTLLLGIEANVSDTVKLGIAGGTADTKVKLDARGSKADTQSLYAAVYGSAAFGAATLRAGASYADLDTDTTRNVGFRSFSEELSASYGGSAVQLFGEVGYTLPLGKGTIEPFVGVNGLWLKDKDFAETGGTAALEGNGRSRSYSWSSLGLRATIGDAGAPVVGRVQVGWEHALGDVDVSSDLRFAAGGGAFRIEGTPLSKDSVQAEAGLDWRATSRLTLSTRYTGNIGDHGQDHGVRATIAIKL